MGIQWQVTFSVRDTDFTQRLNRRFVFFYIFLFDVDYFGFFPRFRGFWVDSKGFRLVPGRFRVVPAGFGRFRVGS